VFEPGRIYVRANVHEEWGGTTQLQREGGILTPREVPIIVVVTGEEGRAFGYEDYWDDEGVFHYFGPGQEGDMQFVEATGRSATRLKTARTSTCSSTSPKAKSNNRHAGLRLF